ncbi:hypothetical protein WDK43_26645, partial [Escherichia coli]
TVWSSEELLSRTDRKDHQTRIRKLAEHAPPARFAQDPWRWTLSALKIRHDALLDTLEQALTHDSDGLLVRLMDIRKRAARTVLTGMCYSVGSATRQGSSSPTRFIGQSAMT